ncbi:MAG: DUF349 domain-containing protein [Erysipelotrichaceae bacterium]|jgi:hypothetical protein|nr:DUF349 domain-containing protein [Erysipelotrichaceae bacterium]MBP1529338.1 DUF349 domain-containing protein [Erysipelotrichaceae bacterium]MBQ1287358.1 DUF349 domain-containing protein [Erysipelotrichaceae bacterium]MBQ1322211.1 DUF349 domain-containing protein [Erysipelotrichaceae bacterium]MBQ1346441.1 DUF349 domain-containing protein [Erysipelotrichaceae bacterium]
MEKNDIREQLIAKLEELLGEENAAEAFLRAKDLKRRWPRVREEEESFSDQELSEKFNKLMDQLSEKAGDVYINTEDRKNQIIAQAKEVLDKNNFKKGTEQMKQLLEDWKHAGRINKEKDDELWAQFSAIRSEFFEKKNEYFANLKETYAANKALKEDLIAKAKEVAGIENIKEAGNRSNELMEEWKKVGSAGRRDDDDLWQQFLAERKAFFERRDAYYDQMKETYAKRVEAKKEIIQEAKLYLARSEFTDDEVNSIKELRAKWKEVGNAGREHENELWEEFNGIVNKYFENMRYYK